MTPEDKATYLVTAFHHDQMIQRDRIASAIREAIAAERERCAKYLEEVARKHREENEEGPGSFCECFGAASLERLAEEIRGC